MKDFFGLLADLFALALIAVLFAVIAVPYVDWLAR